MQPFGAPQNEREAMADGQDAQALSGVLKDLGGWIDPAPGKARGRRGDGCVQREGASLLRRGVRAARAPQGVAAFTRDLMSGDHPACDASDFTVIEDTTTGSIVSSACLIGQRFSYEEVELDAGLPELVGTHPDYRRRGPRSSGRAIRGTTPLEQGARPPDAGDSQHTLLLSPVRLRDGRLDGQGMPGLRSGRTRQAVGRG